MTKGEVLKQILTLSPWSIGVVGIVYVVHLLVIQNHETTMTELKMLDKGIPAVELACYDGVSSSEGAMSILCSQWLEKRDEE